MPVFRVNKNTNYTVMSNYHLRDKNLSLKAKGLLSMMLSLPNDWDYSIKGLVAICQEKETAVQGALNELKKNGYIVVHKLYADKTRNGRIQYVYDIYEHPSDKKQGVGFLGVENLGVEFLGVENPVQLNKEKLNTNKLNKEYKKGHFFVKNKYVNEMQEEYNDLEQFYSN
jgi:hypothetical protein